ncbi:MAG: hypothetical protein IT479_02550 [Xanthomonadales bacterium]|nr:hypothetical protein [Xanthomonadales bacterium]
MSTTIMQPIDWTMDLLPTQALRASIRRRLWRLFFRNGCRQVGPQTVLKARIRADQAATSRPLAAATTAGLQPMPASHDACATHRHRTG